MLEPWQWALAGLAAFSVGLSKTGIPGIGILSVVVFASVLPARESVGIALIVLLAGDVVAVMSYRREANWALLIKLFPWAAFGIILGAFAVGQMNDAVVRTFIGALIVALVLLHLVRRRVVRSDAPEHLPSWVSPVTGVLAGFSTMVANAAGPLMTIYMLSQRLDKRRFIGTTAWYFFALNLFKLPWSYGLGLIGPASFTVSLVLVPCAVVGALTGRWLIAFINQQVFEQVALLLAVVAGVRLLLT